MGVPKRKTSKSRRDKRRAHQRLTLPGLSVCPQCQELRLSHRICPVCGFYKDRQVIEVSDV